MDRREALSLVSILLGGSIVGGEYFLSGCRPKIKNYPFGTLDPIAQLLTSDIAEVILPKTDNAPGAREIEIGKFANTIITDCYSEEEQRVFTQGLNAIAEMCEQKYSKAFGELTANEKQELLLALESESESHSKSRKSGTTPHYYTLIKQLTIWGYLSSELVQTKVVEYVPIPGRFEGCLAYQVGDKVHI